MQLVFFLFYILVLILICNERKVCGVGMVLLLLMKTMTPKWNAVLHAKIIDYWMSFSFV